MSRPTTSTSTGSWSWKRCSPESRRRSWSPTTAPSSTASPRASSSSTGGSCFPFRETSPVTRNARRASSPPRRWPTASSTSSGRRRKPGSGKASKPGAPATSAACAATSADARGAGRGGAGGAALAGGPRQVRSLPRAFVTPPRRANSPVRMLSGGERNRLLLARLFPRPANVLVLDEPTNDLDIESLELLEEALQDYAGTILLVSHDRAFLDNVVTQTLAAEAEGPAKGAGEGGNWKEYGGGDTDPAGQRPHEGGAPPGRLVAANPND